MKRISVYDTTLRDGAQAEGVSFTVAEKLEVVRLLDDIGVDYIEGGWPGSNAKDLEFFGKLRDFPLRHSRVVAFTSTRRKGTRIEEDDHMRAVLGTGMRYCAVVGKTWDRQVSQALRTDLQENLDMISETVYFLKQREIEVIFDAEHFFDGFDRNPDYALESLAAARDAGADWLALCDTNGGALPDRVYETVRKVREAGFSRLGIHTHNDGGLAVANSLAAVRAGAEQVQATVNGFGERCGNADLCVVVPNLVLKMGFSCEMESRLPELRSLSGEIYQIARKEPQFGQPFVGRSAFAHKAGIHVSAVVRDPSLYEHIPPERVGNSRRVLVSELSGVSNVQYRIAALGLRATPEDARRILERVKREEERGRVFEDADASFELLVHEEMNSAVSRRTLLKTSTHAVESGFAVSVSWSGADVTERLDTGAGATEEEAVWNAVHARGPGVSMVSMSASVVERTVGVRVFRAIAQARFGEDWVRTAGVGETAVEAMADAALQVLDWAEMRMAESSVDLAEASGRGGC